MELKTYIKRYYIYKDVWSPVIAKNLQIQMEPDFLVDKYTICVRKYGNLLGIQRREQEAATQAQSFNWSEEINFSNAKQRLLDHSATLMKEDL